LSWWCDSIARQTQRFDYQIRALMPDHSGGLAYGDRSERRQGVYQEHFVHLRANCLTWRPESTSARYTRQSVHICSALVPRVSLTIIRWLPRLSVSRYERSEWNLNFARITKVQEQWQRVHINTGARLLEIARGRKLLAVYRKWHAIAELCFDQYWAWNACLPP